MDYSSDGTLAVAITYGDYLAPGKPMSYVSVGRWEADTYNAAIEYDENGNKVLETHFVPGPVPTYKQVEEWKYDGKMLVEYLKTTFNSTGEEVPYLKTTYWLVDGDENHVMSAESTYFDGMWLLSGRPTL